MSAFTGTIVVKKAGQLIPDAFLERAIKNNPTFFGAAVVTADEQGTTSLEISTTEEGEYSLEAVKELQEALKEGDVLFYFGKFPKEHDLDDRQPFLAVKNSAGDNIIAVCMDGEFPSAPEGSKHSREYHVFGEYLQEKLQSIYDDAGQDLDKFLEKMKAPMVTKEINNLTGPMANITLFTNQADVVPFVKNMNFSFDWGTTSSAYGFETQATADKPAGMLGRLQKVVGRAAPPVPSAKPKAEDKPAEVPAAPKKEEVSEDEYEMRSPPSQLKGRKPLRNWYENVFGSVPDNYKDRPSVRVKKKKVEAKTPPVVQKQETVAKDFKDFPKDRVAATAVTAPAVPTARAAPAVPAKGKDVAPKHVSVDNKPITDKNVRAAEVQAAQEAEEAKILPFIPAHEKQKLVEVFLKSANVTKFMDAKSKDYIHDPKELQKLEEDYPSFTDAAKLNGLEDTFRWPHEVLVNLCKETPIAAARLIEQYRMSYYNTLTSEVKKTEDNKPTETQTTQTSTNVRAAPPVPRRAVAGRR